MQRKIDSLKAQITKLQSDKSKSRSRLHGLVKVVLSSVLHISLCLILYQYRGYAVTRIRPRYFYGSVLPYIIAFPSGGPAGTVSCVFWMFSCQAAVKSVVLFLQSNFLLFKRLNQGASPLETIVRGNLGL